MTTSKMDMVKGINMRHSTPNWRIHRPKR